MKNNRGLSLIEVMVTGSLMVLSAFFGMRTVTNMQRQIDLLKDRLVAREVLDAELSKVESNAGFFPPLSTLGGNALTYVACFTTKGVYTADSEDRTGFVARLLPALTALAQKSGFCGPRDYEVHIQPDGSSFYEAEMAVFMLNDGKVADFYRERIQLESAL